VIIYRDVGYGVGRRPPRSDVARLYRRGAWYARAILSFHLISTMVLGLPRRTHLSLLFR